MIQLNPIGKKIIDLPDWKDVISFDPSIDEALQIHIINAIENEQMKKDIPAFSAGDTVVVQVKVKEGSRERLQAYEGVVIAIKNRGLNSSFTVRKICSSIYS